VVEHRDRFGRFGSEYLEAALAASGRRLIVVDSGEMNNDLVQDMISILTSFCARLYGRRGAQSHAGHRVRVSRSVHSRVPHRRKFNHNRFTIGKLPGKV
jgi:putative resolvase